MLIPGVSLVGMAVTASLYAGCSSSPTGTPSDAGAASDAPIGPPDGQAGPADGGADATPPADAAPFDCTPAPGATGLPDALRCTGLYSDWEAKTVALANQPFTPGYALWSDGAVKSRWIFLPPGTQIDTSNMDEWVFPVGTKVWKEFVLGGRRIETRLFTKLTATPGQGIKNWDNTVYRWSDDESTATKMEAGEQSVNGTQYQIPPKTQCTSCHNGRSDMLLGFDAISLASVNAKGLTLAALKTANLLTVAPLASPQIPEDDTGYAREAFGWLHANCGTACHNANPAALANSPTLPRFRVSAKDILAAMAAGTPLTTKQLDTYLTTVNKPAQSSDYPATYSRIKPGNPDFSLVPKLASSRKDPTFRQMPPILSNIADANGVNKVRVWISNLEVGDGG